MRETWLDDHCGQTVVVKYGGNAMLDGGLTQAFCDDVVRLAQAGIRVVVSHGAGPQISAELAARGIASEFRLGQRVTTPDALEVVRDVLVSIGAELVASLESVGAVATLIAGHDHRVFTARRADIRVDGDPIDLGLVGEVVSVDASMVDAVLAAGGVPVVSAMGHEQGTSQLLNINADLAASSLAAAIKAHWLFLLTDVAGIYSDWPQRETLIATITADEAATMLPSLESGMIPKVTAARDAIAGGVGRVAIIDGRVPHPLTVAAFGTTGTTILPTEGART